MRRPSRAILLAAGFGTRMRPLSWSVPKPLLPLWNRPLALRLLDMLADWGVRDVLVNLHHGANDVFNLLRESVARERLPLRLNFSFEPGILGTGGAIRRAAWFVGEEPFWVVNSDIAADVNPSPFLREMDHRHPLAVLWLDSRTGPRTVEARRGKIITFRSKSPGVAGTATFCGLHLLSPRILEHIPNQPFSSIIDAYDSAIREGMDVRGMESPRSFWRDLGTPTQYLEAHAAWKSWIGARRGLARRRQGSDSRRPRPPRSPFRAMAGAIDLAPDARVEDSVVMEGAVIGSGVTLRNAIVGPAAVVTRSMEGPVVGPHFTAADAPPYRSVVEALGWSPSRTAVNALAPRGSDRSFSRLVCGSRSAILVEYGPLRAENAAYAMHARFLARHGVRVPAVLLDWPEQRMLVIEDAGQRSLESTVPGLRDSAIERIYREVIENVVRLHTIGFRDARPIRDGLQPCFGPSVYRWERELFAHHFLGPRLGLASNARAAVLADLARAARQLSAAPPVIVHRDLQSSNVYLAKDGPVLIDFQGMRYGPAAYDVASLLCDPYVMLSDGLRTRILAYYLDRVPRPGPTRRLFWWAAVERLSQALGAFGRLSESSDTARFAGYIPPALAMMRRALSHLPDLPHLRKAVTRGLRLFPFNNNSTPGDETRPGNEAGKGG